ncbi:MAG: type II secretion system F family protein [Pseudolysinimonas sp.]
MTDAVTIDSVAVLVQRLAVLTGAGIPPLPAWRYLAQAQAQVDRRVLHIVSDASSSHDLPELIAAAARDGPPGDQSPWRALAAVWAVATETGASLSPTLDRLADVLRALAQSAREVEVALAGPAATSRVVLALPVVGLLLGALLGFDLVSAFASAPGMVCLLVGGILITIAVRWNRRLLRWARAVDATPGLDFELLAVALAGGTSVDRASDIVSRACGLAGVEPPGAEVEGVLEFARNAGVPGVGLLRAESDERRLRARTEAAHRAVQLETRLLLPLGLCVLPAFVLVGVVPIALAILSSTVGAI